MTERLVVLGTGPHARELAEIVERVNALAETWELLGFVSERRRGIGRTLDGYPVLGTLGALERLPEARVVAESEWWDLDRIPLERFASIVDPSCFVSRTARLGRGCVLFPNGYVGHHAMLGDLVFCLSGCVVNHGCVLEERVMLSSGVVLAGDVRVEAGSYLGQGSTVRQGIRIGRKSLVGMGSVVVDDVRAGTIVAGNPARLLAASNEHRRSGSGMGEGEYRRLQGLVP